MDARSEWDGIIAPPAAIRKRGAVVRSLKRWYHPILNDRWAANVPEHGTFKQVTR